MDVVDLSPLASITFIGGSLTVSDCPMLTSLAGLSGVTEIQDDLFIGHNNLVLNNLGLPNLETIGSALNLTDNAALTGMTGLDKLTTVKDFWFFGNPELLNFDDLPMLSTIQNSIEISGNDKLEDFTGLEAVTTLGGDVNIVNNLLLTSLQGLENITSFSGGINVFNNPGLTTCAITSICTHLSNGGTISVGGNSGAGGCDSQTEVQNICSPCPTLACNDGLTFNLDASCVYELTDSDLIDQVCAQETYTITITNQNGGVTSGISHLA